MLKTVAIKEFLHGHSCNPFARKYTSDMEVQVNVARDGGNKVSFDYKGKKRAAWSDGTTTWKSFRIPYGAKDTPIFNDTELKFNLSEHAEAIGLTGWNWGESKSMWVGFDIDSICNHMAGISTEDIQAVKQACMTLDYVTVIKSTSGKGLHLYVEFDGDQEPTRTHSEHATLASAILSVMTLDTGYELRDKVDCFGGILWVYSRRQIGTDGFTLVKEAKTKFPARRVPANWRETNKTNVFSKDKKFVDIFSTIKNTPLEEGHRALLKWFQSGAEREYWWDTEHSMLVCHTLDLEKAHKDLKLAGVFSTASSGSSMQNCFGFPEKNGTWVFRRHGTNTSESSSWVVDETGWVKCYYNKAPDIDVASQMNKAVMSQRGHYVFKDHRDGIKALELLNVKLPIPDYIKLNPNKRVMSLIVKDNCLTVIMDLNAGEEPPDNFIVSANKKQMEASIPYFEEKRDIVVPDHLIRFSVSAGVEAGWFLNIKGSWVQQQKSNISTVIMSEYGVNRQESEAYLGKIILTPWYLVNEPFSAEYLGDRRWNRDAAKLACTPKEGPFDTWLSVLKHCGSGLNEAVVNDKWCVDNDILNGADYLACWFANLVQRPKYHLPYLFFIGDQNTGKSTLHEAFGKFIMKKGYVRADNALLAKQGFNGELNGAVLCVVEETNLQKNKEAGDKIKDWVTGKTISIRAMYKNAFDVENHTHWIQCANNINYCVVSDKDTRVVVTLVPPLKTEIPKHKLFEMLESEAPGFLDYLLSIDLPEPEGRLAVSCVTSPEKQELLKSLLSDAEVFIKETGRPCNGELESFDALYEHFTRWLPQDSRHEWTKIKFAMSIPMLENMCKGKMGAENITYVANYTRNMNAKPSRPFKKRMDTNRLYVDALDPEHGGAI